MSYQVLARKWRPRSFADMVGQEHVLKALINALDSDRTHHAYLFTGTRGVGKTTLARILAKCLNCLEGVSSTPCGTCTACVGIDEGRFIDLIEVDAASRARVEETRELMDNVQYTPTSGRYKVYLIDEVHMFSNHSFNALLKTLEEPPPHVKFLLATTEAKKVPVTILSRCMQFNLKHLSVDQIDGQLTRILQAEAITAERQCSRLIARAANGSVRDALSLLDQAIAYGGGDLRLEQVRTMLGSIDSAEVLTLLTHVINAEGEALLQRIHLVSEHNPDYQQLLVDMIDCLQRIALIQVLGEKADTEEHLDERLHSLAAATDPEHIQLLYQIAITGRRDMHLAPEARSGFEMVLIRMLAFQPGGSAHRVPVVPPAAKQADSKDTAVITDKRPQPDPAVDAATAPAPVAAAGVDNWQAVIDEMALAGLVKELAGHTVLKKHTDTAVHLSLAPDKEHLLNQNQKDRLEQAIKTRFGGHMKLLIDVEQPGAQTPAQLEERRREAALEMARESIQNDPNVKAMQELFDATVDENSIELEDRQQTTDNR